MSLSEYRQKRRFRQTDEPQGKVSKTQRRTIFVVHEHHASVLHFDLRLEIGGVLKSWSVPKGPTLAPKVKRLAVEVEDHPLEYAKFDGVIPEGQYGAGSSRIWDTGLVTFHEAAPLKAWDEGHLSFSLFGKTLRGDFALVRLKTGNGKPHWLLIKKSDEFAQSRWRLKLVEPDERFKPETRSKAPATTPRSSPSKGKSEPDSTPMKACRTLSVATFLDRDSLVGSAALRVGKHLVQLSHLDKPYWPRECITKGELIQYYLRIGKTIMPHLKGRPAILTRFPNGIDQAGFVQHNLIGTPSFIDTVALRNEKGRQVNYAVYTNLASLIYLVNLGTIDQHAWLSRVDDLDKPDYIVFDLDPKRAPFRNVLKVALLMKEAFDRMRLRVFAKTSGSSGVHVFLPIKGKYSFAQTMDWARVTAQSIAFRNPRIATTERRLAGRQTAQVYIDWQQNARGKSIAAPYTVRPKPKATVSAPVSWQEIEAGFELSDFTIETMPGRIERTGDLWKEIRRARQLLPNSD